MSGSTLCHERFKSAWILLLVAFADGGNWTRAACAASECAIHYFIASRHLLLLMLFLLSLTIFSWLLLNKTHQIMLIATPTHLIIPAIIHSSVAKARLCDAQKLIVVLQIICSIVSWMSVWCTHKNYANIVVWALIKSEKGLGSGGGTSGRAMVLFLGRPGLNPSTDLSLFSSELLSF